jgi:ketosteroid isomerase-like protein
MNPLESRGPTLYTGRPGPHVRLPPKILFKHQGWPQTIRGVERTLEFISLTIQGCEAISYRAVEYAIVRGGDSAFVRIHFDWTRSGQRLRSNYVVLYRYRDGRIGQQELYYDPSGRLEVLNEAAG